VPRPLRKFLAGHAVYTAQEMGWDQLKNGAPLREAEAQFDALISTDQNLKYQQNLVGRKLAILVLTTNDWPMIRSKADFIVAKVAMLKPGDFVELLGLIAQPTSTAQRHPFGRISEPPQRSGCRRHVQPGELARLSP